MITVTVLVLADIAVRVFERPDDHFTHVVPLILSLGAALLTMIGAAIGGTLVYDYGFNVETAADSPVWHPAEQDLMPGEREDTKNRG
jgi:uncharacterized membrane protein